MRANAYPSNALGVQRNLMAVRTGRGSALAYLRALTLTVWFGSMVISYWWRQDATWVVELHEQGVNLKDYYYTGFAIALAGHLTLGIQKWMSAPFNVLATASGKLLTLFCAAMFLLAPLSASYRASAIYAVATWLVIVLSYAYWSSDYNVVRRVLVFSGVLLFIWLLILMMHHGLRLGFGSAIGGINRNQTSKVGLAAMACCVLSPKKSMRMLGFFGAAFFVIVVGSRGSLLALCVFIGAYYSLTKGTHKAALHAILALSALGMVLLLSGFVADLILEKILALHSEDRGLGSGVSGRWELWMNGLRVFLESPIIGHGFRSAAGGEGFGGVHSGYLKLLAETGVLGTSLILSAVGIDILQRFNLIQQLRRLRPSDLPGVEIMDSIQHNVVVCATLCLTLTLWVYEPLYINLGSVLSIMFFLMIASPRFVSVSPGPVYR